jgi:hypothetical protein
VVVHLLFSDLTGRTHSIKSNLGCLVIRGKKNYRI